MVTWFYFISFAVSLVMVAVFMRRNARIDTVYALFSVLVTLNSLGRWLVAASGTVEQAIWANKIMYVGACFAPLLLVLVLAKLCGLKIPKAITYALTAYSSIVLAAVMTIGYNGLYYKNCSLAEGDGYSYLVKEYGPLHVLYPILMGIDMFVILLLIIYAIKNRRTIPSKTVATIGGLCILILSTYMISRLLHSSVEWHFIGYLVAVIVIARRFEHMNMYDMTANIANSVERLKEYGFIVFDNNSNFVSANELVKSIFPEINDWQTEKPVKKTDSRFYEEVILWYEEHRQSDSENAARTVNFNGQYFRLSIKDIKYGNKKIGELLELVDKTSEHIYMQEIEKARQEAIEANKAKSEFLALISHEIRTPLNAVIGMNEMILRESGEKEISEYAANACNAGKALLSIINNILDISKIEAGKLEIIEDEYELSSLVFDSYNLTAERARKKRLSLSYNVEETLPVKLYGDMFHIRQIIVNLLTNAIKYTDKGSVELSFSGEENENGFSLRVSVKDTGIGLTEESKEKLFTSFQRFDMKRNRSVEGTGLGLAICKKLAELMNGTLYVESEYGKGSEFGILIPQKIADGTHIGQVSQPHSSADREKNAARRFTVNGARILVVDDVEMNLVVFKTLLKGVGLTIDTALSGEACLEMAQKQRYDMIFMDHMMPEMDGVETFEKMREIDGHPNAGTPVIMLTANAINGMREKYLSSGFSGYLSKPIDKEKLNDTLIRFLPAEKVTFLEAESDNSSENAEISEDGRFGTVRRFFPDADIGKGLSHCSGSEDFYIEIMHDLASSSLNDELQKAYDARDWKLYAVKVHAAKGNARTLGLTGFSAEAEKLQKAAEEADAEYIETNHSKVGEFFDTLSECVNKL